MKHSTDRILTTHVGSMPRPTDLRAMLDARQAEQEYDPAALAARVKSSVMDIVKQQADVGLDIINDGEQAKTGWSGYIRDRLAGFEFRDVAAGGGNLERGTERGKGDYEGYFADQARNRRAGGAKQMVCTGPITYIGGADIQADVDNFAAALKGVNVAESFMASVGPDNVGYQPEQNEYYSSEAEYTQACAEALRAEYKAIANAGFVVQVDTPVMKFNALDLELKEFRRRFGELIEIMNHTLQDVPEEQIRLHICYGGMRGPHSEDINLNDFVDLVMNIRSSGISYDQNPRHEHEWKLWRDVKLPDGKVLIPGVVSHTNDVIEHPELIADRLERLANLVGRENVVAGTDCGLGGRVHADVAWGKFRSMVEGAQIASKALWGK
jgi:5-methyltetrahydropteroyltriglutamate--homocysteine methyltransferase